MTKELLQKKREELDKIFQSNIENLGRDDEKELEFHLANEQIKWIDKKLKEIKELEEPKREKVDTLLEWYND